MRTAGSWHNNIKPDNIPLVFSHPDSDLQEVNMLRNMADCEHITKLHEAFTAGDNLNILTELCVGGTLADKVDRDGPLPTATAAKFLEALANFANDCIHKGTFSALRWLV